MKKNILFFILIGITLVVFLIIGKYYFNRPVIVTKTLEDFKSLPYLAYTKEKADETKRGVVKYIPQLSFEGYNINIGEGLKIMDIQGNVIKEWIGRDIMEILDNGDIIMGVKEFNGHVESIIGRYDWFGRKIWERDIIVHHDAALIAEQTILVLSKEKHRYMAREVFFDVVVELSLEDGEEISRWSTYDNLDYLKKIHNFSPLDKLEDSLALDRQIDGGSYSYYYLNSIQVLADTEIGRKDKRFREGNWLISSRSLDMVMILDKETKKVVWKWGPGEIQRQHMPRMLDNGNILIFDNGSRGRGYSRVIELDPVKKEIVWEYKADPPESFFSLDAGNAQRLPNGNTLIISSTKGRVFEVTMSKDIVWEWFNPQINEDGNRAVVSRMIRIPKEKIDRFLNQ